MSSKMKKRDGESGSKDKEPARRRGYRFSPSISDRVYCVIYQRQDNCHAPLALMLIYLLVAVTTMTPYLMEPWLNWWVTYVIFTLPAMGCWQRACATLLHESSSSHASLAKNQLVIFFGGTVGSGDLVLQSWTAYRHLLHHIFLGDRKRDPDLAFQLIWGTYNPQKPWWFAIKYLITPPIWVPPIKLFDLLINRLLVKPKSSLDFVEQCLSIAYFAMICCCLIWLGLGLRCMFCERELSVFRLSRRSPTASICP